MCCSPVFCSIRFLMMKKLFSIFSIAALLLLSACNNGKAPADKNGGQGGGAMAVETQIEFDTLSYDVGVLKEKELRNFHFVFRNTGDKPLVISEVKSHCGCTIVAYSKIPVAPGEEGDITVAMHGSHLNHGSFNKSVEVYSNGSEKPIKLTLKGEYDGPDLEEALKEREKQMQEEQKQ